MIRDHTGKVRWQVMMEKDNSVVQRFFGRDGKERIQLSIDSENVARVRLLDTDGSRRIAAVVGSDGEARLSVLPPHNGGSLNHGGMTLCSLNDRTLTFQLFDQNGTERYSVNSFTNGVLNQRLSDATGHLRILSCADDVNSSGQFFYDAEKKLRNYSVTAASGDCQWAMLDSQGRMRINTTSRAGGGVAQIFTAPDGSAKSSISVDSVGSASQLVAKTDAQLIWEGAGNLLQGIDIIKMFIPSRQ